MKPRLSFMPTTEGFIITQDKYQPGWVMPYVHHHTYHEIYILEYGERLVQIDDENFQAVAYQATFFKSNVPHKSTGSSAFGGICIGFEERYLDKFLTIPAKKQLMQCFKYPIATLTEDEYRKVKELADSYTPFKNSNFIVLINLLNILNMVTQRLNPQDIKVTQNNFTEKSHFIFKYIDDNYRTIKNVTEISQLFGVSESYIFKSFKKKYNVSPRQYINSLKIRNACQLLLYRKDRNAKTISSDCGFESYEYFMRLFKKKMGCTPLAYRESNHIQTKE